MATRIIVTKEDSVLRKVCKPVEKFDDKLWQLLDDMKETMAKADGVGLAAPQVGVLRRITVIDAGNGYYELINPRIVKSSGKRRSVEGCLSCPKQWGYVTRPAKAVVVAQDRYGNEYELKVDELFCTCVFHELDHLEGKLFIDFVEEWVEPEEE